MEGSIEPVDLTNNCTAESVGALPSEHSSAKHNNTFHDFLKKNIPFLPIPPSLKSDVPPTTDTNTLAASDGSDSLDDGYGINGGNTNDDAQLSRELDNSNICLTLAAAGVTISFLTSLTRQLLHLLYLILASRRSDHMVNHYDIFQNNVFTAIQTIFILSFLWLVAHRIAGYILSIFLRFILRKHCCSIGSADNGVFDVHIGWVSYRGFWDHNELTIRHLVWFNHPIFNRTPYLLRIKELTISFDISALISTLRSGSSLKFDHVLVDGVELYFERFDGQLEADTYSMNAFAAMGVKGKESENNTLHKMFMFIVGKILEKLALSKKTHPSTSASEQMLEAKLLEASHAASPIAETGDSSKQSSNGSMSQKGKQSPELTVELNRLMLFDLVVHPLDLLSGEHMQATKGTDICLEQLTMTRKDITGPPTAKGGDRVALPGSKFGGIHDFYLQNKYSR